MRRDRLTVSSIRKTKYPDLCSPRCSIPPLSVGAILPHAESVHSRSPSLWASQQLPPKSRRCHLSSSSGTRSRSLCSSRWVNVGRKCTGIANVARSYNTSAENLAASDTRKDSTAGKSPSRIISLRYFPKSSRSGALFEEEVYRVVP